MWLLLAGLELCCISNGVFSAGAAVIIINIKKCVLQVRVLPSKTSLSPQQRLKECC